MIDYETYCRIRQCHEQGLRISQIADKLAMDPRTVHYWLEAGSYHQRKKAERPGKLDAYKPQILQRLEKYSYTSEQMFRQIKESGYVGGITILKDYMTKIRPRKTTPYLTLSFAPGECAQVDWGHYGSVQVGSTRRKLSFFVMVLCYSRMMYVEFTVSQTMEHFLGCHVNAFNFFGAVPEKIMVDNLKSAVIKRMVGQAPVFNAKYLDFANHYGFKIKACAVAKGNEKGRVENAVGYVKKSFLGGLDMPEFSAVNPGTRQWMDEVANVRVHGTIKKRPVDVFDAEKRSLRPLPSELYNIATIKPVRATKMFRVVLDTNRYSVPHEHAGAKLGMHVWPDRVCFYHENNLIARHTRSYDRHQDIEDPDHPKALLQQRRRAKDQRLYMSFLKLSPKAEEYHNELANRRMNPKHHVRQIVALSEIYSADEMARALDDAFTLQAFSCEYIANILEQRKHIAKEPGALHLTRRQDLLDMDIPEPNLSIYENDNENSKESRNNES